MANGTESAAMEDSVNRLEDEVRRAVEQAKELHDMAGSIIAKSTNDEQLIRHRAASLDSTIRRIKCLIDSQNCRKLLDPHLSEKACSLLLSFDRPCSFIDYILSELRGVSKNYNHKIELYTLMISYNKWTYVGMNIEMTLRKTIGGEHNMLKFDNC